MRPNPTPSRAPRRRAGRTRRWALALGSLAASVLLVAGPHSAAALPATAPGVAQAAQVASTTTTSEALAGTTLEADSRDDGTAVAPWLIWSGIAAGASVLIGGLLLKRRMT